MEAIIPPCGLQHACSEPPCEFQIQSCDEMVAAVVQVVLCLVEKKHKSVNPRAAEAMIF